MSAVDFFSRHSYGSLSHLFKNAVLGSILRQLRAHTTPFTYLDFNAGPGVYDTERGQLTEEMKKEILWRFWPAYEKAVLWDTNALAPAVQSLRAFHEQLGSDISPARFPNFFPSTAGLGQLFLREQDRGIFIESLPDHFERLDAFINRDGPDHRISLLQGFPYEYHNQIVKPVTQTGLAHFELLSTHMDWQTQNFYFIEEFGKLLKELSHNWPGGVKTIFYELNGVPPVHLWREAVKTGHHRIVKIEMLDTRPETFYPAQPRGLGFVVINPPEGLTRDWEELVHILQAFLPGWEFSVSGEEYMRSVQGTQDQQYRAVELRAGREKDVMQANKHEVLWAHEETDLDEFDDGEEAERSEPDDDEHEANQFITEDNDYDDEEDGIEKPEHIPEKEWVHLYKPLLWLKPRQANWQKHIGAESKTRIGWNWTIPPTDDEGVSQEDHDIEDQFEAHEAREAEKAKTDQWRRSRGEWTFDPFARFEKEREDLWTYCATGKLPDKWRPEEISPIDELIQDDPLLDLSGRDLVEQYVMEMGEAKTMEEKLAVKELYRESLMMYNTQLPLEVGKVPAGRQHQSEMFNLKLREKYELKRLPVRGVIRETSEEEEAELAGKA